MHSLGNALDWKKPGDIQKEEERNASLLSTLLLLLATALATFFVLLVPSSSSHCVGNCVYLSDSVPARFYL